MVAGDGWVRQIRARFVARTVPSRLVQLIRLAILVIEGIIAARILLKLALANPQAGFTSFIDGLSAPFVGAFHPVFADQSVSGHPLEVGSLLAMAVYAALALLAIRVVKLAFRAAHV